MIDVEAKKAEAKELRGVSYDARIDRFTAEIYAGGVRRWLGSYSTAREAHDAYLEADAAREVVKRVSAFGQAYAAFREAHGGRDRTPPDGATLEYDGQVFRFTGLTWRKGGAGRPFAYMTWSSQCKTCGVEYKTMSPAAVSIAKGITRNCPQHKRAASGFALRGPERKPVTISEQIAAALEPVSLLRESVTLDEAAALVHASGRLEAYDAGAMGRVLQRSIDLGDAHSGFMSILGDRVYFV